MGAFGTVQIGRITLREDRDLSRTVDASTGGVSLKLTGQESNPHLTTAQVEQRGADVIASYGQLVPVSFTEKTNLNGYYYVADFEVDQNKYVQDGANLVPWSMNLSLVGSDTEIDLESRLGGAQTRSNSYSLSTGERWHCPPAGTVGYFAGSAIPSVLTRASADGNLTVYRGVTYGAYPRWGCPVGSYGLGRCQLLNQTVERSGIIFPADVTNWEMRNGIVRVKPLTASGALEISAWTGAAWQAKNYDVLANGTTLAPWTSISVLQNDYHKTSIRLMKTSSTLGRVTCDITLRRGSRFAELYMQSATSTTLKLARATTEAGTAAANNSYIKATAADGAGNKYVIGSANTFTLDLANGALSKAGVVALDAFVAVEIASAPAGDVAADLYNQYLGIPSEMITGVRR